MDEKEKTKRRQIKIGVNKEAEEEVEKMHKRVTEGFYSGKITKPDLVSWILLKFSKNYLDGSIEEIRSLHFDPLRNMEAMLRDLKRRQKKGEALPNIEIKLN